MRDEELLARWQEGEKEAFDELFLRALPEIYSDARRKMRNERPNHTLQGTALAHDVYVKLVTRPPRDWRDMKGFTRGVTREMRTHLLDWAKQKATQKHGGSVRKVPLEFLEIHGPYVPIDPGDLADLEDALQELARIHPEAAEMVDDKICGRTHAEIARLHGVSIRTVEARLAIARSFLLKRLRP